MNDEIQAIFGTRDEAVRTQDASLFLSTQLAEIELGLSESYLSIADMATEVLFGYEQSDDNVVVLARETYRPPGKHSHSSFLIYYLIQTTKGWKIYKVR